MLQGNSGLVAEVKVMLETCNLVDYEMLEIDYVFHATTCLVSYVARRRSRCSSVSLHPDSMADRQLVALLLGLSEPASLTASSKSN